MNSDLSSSRHANSARGQPPATGSERSADEIRNRFDWAVSQGNPGWLWPEISVADWQECTSRIAAVSHHVLMGRTSAPALAGDPRAMGIAAYISGMGPLLGYWLNEGIVSADEPVSAVLRTHLQENQRRTTKLVAQAVAIVTALHRNGIDVTVLKGMHTAFAYLPEPAVRPMSDIDLLIEATDEAKARRVLLELGYVPGRVNACPRQQTWTKRGVSSEPRSLEFVHRDDPWSLDLQFSLNRRASVGSAVAELDRIGRVASKRHPWPVDRRAVVLGQPLLTLYHACHASCDFSSLTLLRLVELALIIRKDRATGSLSWSDLVRTGETAGALGQAYPALRYCEMLAPGTVPSRVLAAARGRVPTRALQFIDRLEPSTAHRVLRCSIQERFMWITSKLGLVRQLSDDLFLPSAPSFGEALKIHRQRLFRLARGGISR